MNNLTPEIVQANIFTYILKAYAENWDEAALQYLFNDEIRYQYDHYANVQNATGTIDRRNAFWNIHLASLVENPDDTLKDMLINKAVMWMFPGDRDVVQHPATLEDLIIDVTTQYKQSPSYNSKEAVKIRKNFAQAKKAQSPVGESSQLEAANSKWRDAIVKRDGNHKLWKEHLATIRSEQLEEWKTAKKSAEDYLTNMRTRHAQIYGEQRTQADSAMKDWDSYVHACRSAYQSLKNQ